MVLSVNRVIEDVNKYSAEDQSLIPSKEFQRNFGEPNDYVEAHIYSRGGELLQSDYRYRGYQIPPEINVAVTPIVNHLTFDAAAHLQELQYTVGDYRVIYNAYRKRIFDLAEKIFYIKEISSDRTELRIISNVVSNNTVEQNTLQLIQEIQNSLFFKDFLLNFGDDKTVTAVNIALDKSTSPYSIIVKLYEPLPEEFQAKSSLWFVEELSNPIIFDVSLALDPVTEEVEFLWPANFDINLDANQAISSPYQSISTIYSSDSLTYYQNIVNRLKRDSIDINVDYSDFANFIHFSSATERLTNFFYKMETVEGYKETIDTLKAVPNYTSGSVNTNIQNLEKAITGIIEKFDGYENYLYYVSESNSWPKTGVYPNYTLLPSTSSQVLQWVGSSNEDSPYYGGMFLTSSLYDLDNQNNLVFSIPEFISGDETNASYLLFVNMIGQQFDNLWIYIKAINDLNKADNSFKEGISKDMVYTALRSLGVKLYNNNTNENVFDYLIGNTSGSYNVTASMQPTSGEDRSKELFKRLYHNLPYLLKSKGTNRGIKALISTFGIPSTILDVKEYGGSDKFSSSLEYTYDRFSYALRNTGSANFDVAWSPLTQNNLKYGVYAFVADTIELRFKPDVNNIKDKVTLLQQYSDGLSVVNFGVTMDYTSSNGTPSANVNFLISDNTQYVSSSLTLPIYATGSDGSSYWWNLMLGRKYKYTSYDSGSGEPYDTASIQQYDLFIKTSDNGEITHQASASVYATGSNRFFINNSWSYFGNIQTHNFLTVGSPTYVNTFFPTGSGFNGNLQELRLWSEPLQESAFNMHVLNPESYEGNYSGSAYNDLAARFPLGNNLVTYNHSSSVTIESVHPNYKVPYSSGSVGSLFNISLYGSAIYGAKYFDNENKAYFYRYPDKNNYDSFYYKVYASTPNSGYYAPVTEKVRIVDNTIDSPVLSPSVRLETPSEYRTNDTHFTDVSFSPQNEVDKDIIAQLGTTVNIDDLIGDPNDQYNDNYSNLDIQKKEYFQKYKSKYNFTDYIRLIKSVDNTLFKMIEDYVPARTNLSTGITIKSPILERNKVKRHKPVVENVGEYQDVIDELNIHADSSHTDTDGAADKFIDGILPGSYIDFGEEFERDNFNPYALPTGSVNSSVFELTDYNTLQGVATNNVTSSRFVKIDRDNDEIVDVAELQDGYYEYKRHTLPRYEGSKSTSAKYNVYTVGDSSYGKNAAIDYNVGKFAWVDSIESKCINFYNKTTLNLKYLIDASGSLTELNRSNENVFEVQNTFKSFDQATVSLFDKARPTNQGILNGSKEIFVGGFSYSPILFKELDETVYFEYLNPTITQSINLGIKAFSTSSYTYEAWDGATVRDPIESAVNSGAGYFYRVNGSIDNTTGQAMAAIAYTPSEWPYVSSSVPGINYVDLGGIAPSRTVEGKTYGFDLLQFSSLSGGGYNTELDPSTYQNYNGEYYYLIPRSGDYTISGSLNFSFKGSDAGVGWSLFKVVGIVEKTSTPDTQSSWSYVASTTLTSLGNPSGGGTGWGYQFDSVSNTIKFDADMYSNWNFNLNIPSATVVNLTAGEYVRFRFHFIDLRLGFASWNRFQIFLTPGSFFEIYDTDTRIVNLVTTGSIGQTPPILTYDTGTNKGVVFNDSASLEFYSQSVFIPNAAIAENYSPVTDIFTIEPNDLFRFGSFDSPASVYYEVEKVEKTPNVKVTFRSSTDIPSGSISSEAFAILRKVPDETCVMLNFKKTEGETSKSILIPGNLELPVLKEVANIVEPLKISLSTQ